MSREIAVRSYCTRDLEDIKEILSEYPSPTDRAWSENMVEEMMSAALREQPDGVFVAVKGGKVVGFAIVIYRDWFNIAYLDYIQVKTSHINKGIGYRLIEKCVNWAREKQRKSHQILSKTRLPGYWSHPRLLSKRIRRRDSCEQIKLVSS